MKAKSPVKLCQDLVAIRSVNPQGDPGIPMSQANESAMADYLDAAFRSIGLATRRQMVFPGRPNIIGSTELNKKGRRKLPHLLLCPHTDTVSVVGMTIDPFDPKVRNGRLYGRGSCDTKGPLSAMLWALKNVLEKRPQDLQYDVTFAAVMGEEAGNDGIRHLMKSGFTADFAIAGEPTDMNPVHTHKGAFWLRIEGHGKAVHSSQPQNGKNAIYEVARAVTCLEQEYFPKLQKVKNKVLGAPTCSVGTVHGGSKVNIVPDFCAAEVDFRTVPGQPDILRELKALFRKRRINVTLVATRGCKPLFTDPDNDHIRSLCYVSQQLAGRGKLWGAPWFCDAAIVAEHGIPAIAWGPGGIEQAHTKDEYIEVRELEMGARVFETFLTTPV